METRLSSRGRQVVVSRDRSFVIIGERINPTGRNVLSAEMKQGMMDRVRADAAAQAAAGAHMLDDQLGNNMTCGASNVSFGLADRPTVNAAFLALAMRAGLTCAITNPLEPQVRRAILVGDLLLGHDEYAKRWLATLRAD